MKSKNTRVFLLEGKSYQFNFVVFMRLFIVKASEFNMKYGEHEQFLADELLVSREAIHNWRNNLNGPSGIDIIQNLATIWKVDYHCLLIEIKEIETEGVTMKVNDEISYVREAIKKVYGAMDDFLEFFEKTNGLQNGTTEETRNSLLLAANVKKDYVITVLRKEMLDIPEQLYDRLYGFINDRLNYILEGEPFEDEDPSLWTGDVIFVVEETYKLIQELLADYRL